jgi:type I restriction enzyme S subunit
MITAVDCTIARFDESLIIPLLFVSYSQTDEYSRAVASLSSGSTRARISRGALEALEVPVPNMAEQQRIADCLSSLDTRITAESRQLAALKLHKQGLMQQLFPAPEA